MVNSSGRELPVLVRRFPVPLSQYVLSLEWLRTFLCPFKHFFFCSLENARSLVETPGRCKLATFREGMGWGKKLVTSSAAVTIKRCTQFGAARVGHKINLFFCFRRGENMADVQLRTKRGGGRGGVNKDSLGHGNMADVPL